jgi:hypothetical protein
MIGLIRDGQIITQVCGIHSFRPQWTSTIPTLAMRTLTRLLPFLALLSLGSAHAADDYYSEVRLEVAVRTISLSTVDPLMRSHIEGTAAALSYVYDCSAVSPGLLRSFVRVSDALVQYSKSDWGKLSGPEYGNLTVAGALQAYITRDLKCRIRE